MLKIAFCRPASVKKLLFRAITFQILILIFGGVGWSQCSGLFIVESTSGNLGYINCKGDLVSTGMGYSKAFDFADGLGGFSAPGRSKIVTVDGRETVLDGLEIQGPFSEGRAVARMSEREFAYIDSSGIILRRYMVPERSTWGQRYQNYDYSPITSFHCGRAAIEVEEDDWRLIDKEFNKISKTSFVSISEFDNGLAPASIRLETGVIGDGIIDTSGTFVFGPKVDSDLSYGSKIATSEGLIVYRESPMRWIVMDSKGRFLFARDVAWLGHFHDGLAPFSCVLSAASKKGFLDAAGRIVIEPAYTTQSYFSDGLLVVKSNGKYGFLSKTGEMKIPAIFDIVSSPFDRGMAYVRQGSFEGYIDVKGNWVWKRPIDK